PPKQTDKDPKKAAIEAAIERAKTRKASLADKGAAPRNTEQLTPAQQKQIEAVDKRRANTPKNDA
ncbi:MAG: electron transport complex subunit RsxB, partial [Pseudomonadota bacterium]